LPPRTLTKRWTRLRSSSLVEEVFSMAKDPVCGMEVKENQAKATSEYKGQKYHFCAVACKQRFDKEPEKYLKKGKK
jgi:YHS domain-containing protein